MTHLKLLLLLVFIPTSSGSECLNMTDEHDIYYMVACWNMENVTYFHGQASYLLSYEDGRLMFHLLDNCAFYNLGTENMDEICPTDNTTKNDTLCTSIHLSNAHSASICYNKNKLRPRYALYYIDNVLVFNFTSYEYNFMFAHLATYHQWRQNYIQLAIDNPIPPCKDKLYIGPRMTLDACWGKPFVLYQNNNSVTFDYIYADRVFELLYQCIPATSETPNQCLTLPGSETCDLEARFNEFDLCLDSEYNILTGRFGSNVTNMRYKDLLWLYFSIKDYVLAYRARLEA